MAAYFGPAARRLVQLPQRAGAVLHLHEQARQAQARFEKARIDFERPIVRVARTLQLIGAFVQAAQAQLHVGVVRPQRDGALQRPHGAGHVAGRIAAVARSRSRLSQAHSTTVRGRLAGVSASRSSKSADCGLEIAAVVGGEGAPERAARHERGRSSRRNTRSPLTPSHEQHGGGAERHAPVVVHRQGQTLRSPSRRGAAARTAAGRSGRTAGPADQGRPRNTPTLPSRLLRPQRGGAHRRPTSAAAASPNTRYAIAGRGDRRRRRQRRAAPPCRSGNAPDQAAVLARPQMRRRCARRTTGAPRWSTGATHPAAKRRRMQGQGHATTTARGPR